MDTKSTSSTLIPRLVVTAHLPDVISFSSEVVPELELQIKLEFAQPVILFLERSRLWPLHPRSALAIHNIDTGRQEYIPQVDAPYNPKIPPLTNEYKSKFLSLKPGETTIIRVSFRPYDERYKYDASRDSMTERYKMLFPIGMQFLKPGERYQIGIQERVREGYMLGDLDEILGRHDQGAVWAPKNDSIEVVPGEPCQFHVVD